MKNSADVYAHFTLSRINNELKDAPLTQAQQEAVYQALLASESRQRHSVDIRLYIPALYRSFYIVLFAGRDRRSNSLAIQRIRFFKTKHNILRLIRNLALILLSFSGVGVLFWAAYLLKSYMGIDLIPGFHLSEYVSKLFSE